MIGAIYNAGEIVKVYDLQNHLEETLYIKNNEFILLDEDISAQTVGLTTGMQAMIVIDCRGNYNKLNSRYFVRFI